MKNFVVSGFRGTVCTVLIFCGMSAALPAAAAYPEKTLRLVVPFPPGGGNDILARTLGQRLSEVVSQQVVVDNRGGAGGALGATIAAQANPDGYTIFLGSVGNLAQTPALKEKLPYHPLRDFAPVALVATSSFILAVHPSVQAKTVQELIALAKASPGKLNYASAGAGSSLHMAGELFKYATATDLLHVPYKGTGPAMADLISGRVQLIFSTMPPALPQIKTGKLRALGVTTAKRSPQVPDYPSAQEAGIPGVDASIWVGLFAPKGTPKEVLAALYKASADVLTQPDVKKRYGQVGGAETTTMGSAEFTKRVRADLERYRKVAAQVGIQQQ